MRVAVVTADLLTYSRIEAAASSAGWIVDRVDSPIDLPTAATLDLVLVDWADRGPSWRLDLETWRTRVTDSSPRIIAFGPHTDLSAHVSAREANLAPMWARSRLFRSLPALFRPPSGVAAGTRSGEPEG
jgi:DNA-binding response OmpR family regulator